MDQQLRELFTTAGTGEKYRQTGRGLVVLDPASGEIEIKGRGEPRRYTLKPLRDLYGEGNKTDAVDPEDDVFMPLFLAIEEEIARFYKFDNAKLGDGGVALVLSQIGMDPEASAGDPLALQIQMSLRVCLSLNNYSRQEVKAALRKIGKSVDRHTRADGPRGYLDFIADFFAQG